MLLGTQPERSERFTAGSGKVAHLFRRLDARALKILSVKRSRAGRLDVGARASSLTLDLHAVGLTPAHSHGYGACAGVSPAFWRGRPRAPARAPAQSPLARRSNLITHPYHVTTSHVTRHVVPGPEVELTQGHTERVRARIADG